MLNSNPTGHSYWDLSSFLIILLLSDDEGFLVVDMDFALPWRLNPSPLPLNKQYIIHFLNMSMLASQVDPTGAHGGMVWCEDSVEMFWQLKFFFLPFNFVISVLDLCNDSFMWDLSKTKKLLFFPFCLEIVTVPISYKRLISKLHQVNQKCTWVLLPPRTCSWIYGAQWVSAYHSLARLVHISGVCAGT